MSVIDPPRALVASAVLGRTAWRNALLRQLEARLPLLAPARLHPMLDGAADRVRARLDHVEHYAELVRDLKERIAARVESVRGQLARPAAAAPAFDTEGRAALGPWKSLSECEDATIEETTRDGRPVLIFRAGPSRVCIASVRQRVLLPHGRYEFRALARAENMISIRDDWGSGAGLRTSHEGRANRVAGTTGWRELSCEVEVDGESREVELVVETRARTGEAWFDRGSITLRRSD
jgi:hypothetical protein